MKAFLKIILILLAIVTVFSLCACNGGTNDTPDTPDTPGNSDTPDEGSGDEGDGIDWDNTGLEGLALIYEKKARFQVVYASSAGSTAIREANNFVSRLRELGIDVADPVADTEADKVAECEIIFGANVRNRSEELTVTDKYLGAKGKTIKVVGTSIVVAAGSSGELKNVITRFTTTVLGIKSSLKKLDSLSIEADFFEESLTTYSITSIKIGSEDLRGYVIVEDFDENDLEDYSLDKIGSFRDDLYKESGIWLEYVDAANADQYEHKIVIRYVADRSAMNEAGFAAYVDSGKNLIVECSYANAFDSAFDTLMDGLILGESGSISIASSYSYVSRVCEVTYEMFGADGTDAIDDFDAIFEAHTFANQCGQTVIGKADATYCIGPSILKTIPIKTNVDFNGCTILINDVGSEAYKTRGLSLFTLARDHANVTLNEARVDEIAGADAKIRFGDTSIPWLADYIETKSLVMISNSYHKDFIRFGANQSSGETRKDVYIMYPDGSIDPETEVCFEFDEITLVEISRVDDTPVTVKNGNFVNICCRTVAETEFKNKYNAYNRGFRFERSNVTFENITHRMQDEPDIDTSFGNWGELKESYPYYAFIFTAQTYNLLIKDCDLTAHTTYYEDKDATASTGGVKPNPVAQGTYDIAVERSIDVRFVDTVQYAPTGLGDSRYWGIMTSNWSKNMLFENCEINRFDAHRSFWGAKLINCNIGHSINLVGGGDLYMENVTKMVRGSYISIRGDYGGTFSGNIHMVNCTLAGVNEYNSVRGTYYNPSSIVDTGIVFDVGYMNSNDNGYWDWYFGYTSYMPQNIILDNFKSGAKQTFLFPAFDDGVFTEAKYPLVITKQITFRNMSAIPLSPGEASLLVNRIPYTVENNNEEE